MTLYQQVELRSKLLHDVDYMRQVDVTCQNSQFCYSIDGRWRLVWAVRYEWLPSADVKGLNYQVVNFNLRSFALLDRRRTPFLEFFNESLGLYGGTTVCRSDPRLADPTVDAGKFAWIDSRPMKTEAISTAESRRALWCVVTALAATTRAEVDEWHRARKS